MQKLRQEWGRLTFWLGEDVDDFALRFSGLVQQLARQGDIDEKKVVEKYLRVVPKKYTQITLSMETLLDLLTLSIEEVTGRLKAVDDHEEAPPANPVSADDKLLFIEEQARSLEGEEEEAGGLVFVQRSSPTTTQEEQ
jgi:hypothetical protein